MRKLWWRGSISQFGASSKSCGRRLSGNSIKFPKQHSLILRTTSGCESDLLKELYGSLDICEAKQLETVEGCVIISPCSESPLMYRMGSCPPCNGTSKLKTYSDTLNVSLTDMIRLLYLKSSLLTSLWLQVSPGEHWKSETDLVDKALNQIVSFLEIIPSFAKVEKLRMALVQFWAADKEVKFLKTKLSSQINKKLIEQLPEFCFSPKSPQLSKRVIPQANFENFTPNLAVCAAKDSFFLLVNMFRTSCPPEGCFFEDFQPRQSDMANWWSINGNPENDNVANSADDVSQTIDCSVLPNVMGQLKADKNGCFCGAIAFAAMQESKIVNELEKRLRKLYLSREFPRCNGGTSFSEEQMHRLAGTEQGDRFLIWDPFCGSGMLLRTIARMLLKTPLHLLSSTLFDNGFAEVIRSVQSQKELHSSTWKQWQATAWPYTTRTPPQKFLSQIALIGSDSREFLVNVFAEDFRKWSLEYSSLTDRKQDAATTKEEQLEFPLVFQEDFQAFAKPILISSNTSEARGLISGCSISRCKLPLHVEIYHCLDIEKLSKFMRKPIILTAFPGSSVQLEDPQFRKMFDVKIQSFDRLIGSRNDWGDVFVITSSKRFLSRSELEWRTIREFRLERGISIIILTWNGNFKEGWRGLTGSLLNQYDII